MGRLNGLAASVRAQGIAIGVVMTLFVGSGIMLADRVENSIDQLVAATRIARLQTVSAQALLGALQDAETGQRGYMLTGRPYYLEPYYLTIGRIDQLLADLRDRTRTSNPTIQDNAARLDAAVRQKVDELRRTVVTAQRDGIPAAMPDIMTDAGKAYMDGVRAAAARVMERAEADRAQYAETLNRRQGLFTDLLLVALVSAVVLLGAAALVLLINFHRLRMARVAEQHQAGRVAAAVEHVPDGVAVFDAAGCLALANTRFAPALGIPPNLAATGATLAAIAAAAALDPPLTVARPAEARSAEARQGARTLEVWRSPMPDGGQMLSALDVTRRVAAEEVGRQAQKMDVLGQMTGGVAHDFNNLLQIVSANLELVRSKLERTGVEQALLARLDAASAGVARGARLTRHLLAFARRQPLAPEPLDPGRLLMGMEETLRRTLGESVALEVVLGGGLWSMRADPTQFENAILNLALNARDAMTGPDGVPAGKLTIEAANAALDEAYAARSADVTPGQYVMFAVTDTGPGMTPQQLGRAVEPFYTTKPEGRGTGLGLPMVLGFAKQSGGHFQLYSEPGSGTTARIYIPRTTAAVAPPEPAPTALPAGNGELVLLVEDDAAVRQASRDALVGLRYQVVEADSADAAIALLESGCAPRILFTDVVMPGKATSRQLAARAKTLVPGIAVLFTSGYTQNSIVHNGQLDPDVALISKPWRADDLARALRSALVGGAARAPAARRILLVEDEELVRMTTADALADLGFDVLQASTAAAALTRLDPAPDLLLTDLGLPDRNGMDLVAEARRRLPNLPVIVVSGQSESPGGDIVWLPKPYDVTQLKRAVAAAFADSSQGR